MRNFVQGILATLVVLALGGWLYLRLGYADLRANAEPSWRRCSCSRLGWHCSRRWYPEPASARKSLRPNKRAWPGAHPVCPVAGRY